MQFFTNLETQGDVNAFTRTALLLTSLPGVISPWLSLLFL